MFVTERRIQIVTVHVGALPLINDNEDDIRTLRVGAVRQKGHLGPVAHSLQTPKHGWRF